MSGRIKLVMLALVWILAAAGCAYFSPEERDARDSDIELSVLMKKMKAASDPRMLCTRAQTYVLRQQQVPDPDNLNPHDRTIKIEFQRQPFFTKTIDLTDGKVDGVILFDGTEAWNINYQLGSSTKLEGLQLKMMQTVGKISNPAYSYTDIFSHIDVKLVFWENREYYRLICRTGDDDVPPLTVYVDKNNYRPRKVSIDFVNLDGNKVNYVSYINEYALFSEVMMPSLITVEINDEKTQYRTLEFTLNIQFPPDEFVLPKPWYLKAGTKGGAK